MILKFSIHTFLLYQYTHFLLNQFKLQSWISLHDSVLILHYEVIQKEVIEPLLSSKKLYYNKIKKPS